MAKVKKTVEKKLVLPESSTSEVPSVPESTASPVSTPKPKVPDLSKKSGKTTAAKKTKLKKTPVAVAPPSKSKEKTGKKAAKAAAKPARKAASAREGKEPAIKKAAVAAPIVLDHEAVSIRAYLISEKRQQFGIPGNETEDWAQAERELTEEAAESV